MWIISGLQALKKFPDLKSIEQLGEEKKVSEIKFNFLKVGMALWVWPVRVWPMWAAIPYTQHT